MGRWIVRLVQYLGEDLVWGVQYGLKVWYELAPPDGKVTIKQRYEACTSKYFYRYYDKGEVANRQHDYVGKCEIRMSGRYEQKWLRAQAVFCQRHSYKGRGGHQLAQQKWPRAQPWPNPNPIIYHHSYLTTQRQGLILLGKSTWVQKFTRGQKCTFGHQLRIEF